MLPRILTLLVLASLLVGGVAYIGQDQTLEYNWVVRDVNFAGVIENCWPTTVTVANTDSRAQCFVPPGRTLIIESFGVTAADDLDAGTEDCEILLETSNTGSDLTGTEVAASEINVGDSNADATCGTLDDRGEGCLRTNLNTVVQGGGWWRVTFDDPDGGGALVCSVMTGVSLYVQARLH